MLFHGTRLCWLPLPLPRRGAYRLSRGSKASPSHLLSKIPQRLDTAGRTHVSSCELPLETQPTSPCVPISKSTVVHVHHGTLCSCKRETAYPLRRRGGTWSEISRETSAAESHLLVEHSEQNKLSTKRDPETWKWDRLTNLRGTGAGRELIRVHAQPVGSDTRLGRCGAGERGGGAQWGTKGDACNTCNNNEKFKKQNK